MRRGTFLGFICLAAAGPPCASAQDAAQQDARAEERRRAWALADEIQARVNAGSATPAADAAAAAARGEFGLMTTAGHYGNIQAPGAICYTVNGRPAQSRAIYRYGDSIGEQEARWFNYADAYNRALTARPDYPDADLCRPGTEPGDGTLHFDERGATQAARPAGRPPRTLHEAARWGNAADVRRLLPGGPVDALDAMEMSPLAWAVARGNRPAADALLAAGANPWAGPEWQGGWAVYLAAILGRGDWFALLADRPGRPFERWSSVQLMAAVTGGEPAILARMLREPHEPPRVDMLRHPLPATAMIEMLLRDAPGQAGPLLRRAADYNGRADLVRLALAYGADPNAEPPQSGQETVLGMAAKGIGADSVETVDLLLRAGADPNRMSWHQRPLWVAVGILKLDNQQTEIDARATAIFHRLLAAGANINLPDFQGRPPVFRLLFPRTFAHRELDASFVTPRLLEMLAGAGLDLNARWQGVRVLSLVEAQAGRNAELAVTLRRLGARR